MTGAEAANDPQKFCEAKPAKLNLYPTRMAWRGVAGRQFSMPFALFLETPCGGVLGGVSRDTHPPGVTTDPSNTLLLCILRRRMCPFASPSCPPLQLTGTSRANTGRIDGSTTHLHGRMTLNHLAVGHRTKTATKIWRLAAQPLDATGHYQLACGYRTLRRASSARVKHSPAHGRSAIPVGSADPQNGTRSKKLSNGQTHFLVSLTP